jgi:hypothetical protein
LMEVRSHSCTPWLTSSCVETLPSHFPGLQPRIPPSSNQIPLDPLPVCLHACFLPSGAPCAKHLHSCMLTTSCLETLQSVYSSLDWNPPSPNQKVGTGLWTQSQLGL